MSDERDNMKRLLALTRSITQSRSVDPATATAAAAAAATHAESLALTEDSVSGSMARRPGPAPGALSARDNPREFVAHYTSLLQQFCADATKLTLSLPNIPSYERHVLHALVERCNLSHRSTGEGSARVLHIAKDALFFQNPEAAQAVDVDELVGKITGKRSKFDVQRRAPRGDPAALTPGDIGSYDDEETERRLARLRAATDEYRHATQMGYALEEAGADGSGSGSVEERLARTEGEGVGEGKGGRPVPALTAGPARGAHTSDTHLGAKRPREAEEAETVTSAETCTRCHTRRPLEDPSRWQCMRHCEVCGKTTVWRMEERKRPRPAEPTATEAAAAAEAIDRTLHTEEEEALTLEDIAETLSLNDYSEADQNWVRSLAAGLAVPPGQRIAFFMDFADAGEASLFRSGAGDCRYAAVAAAPDLSLSLSQLLEALTHAALVEAEEEAEGPMPLQRTEDEWAEWRCRRCRESLRLALANVSVYGSAARALCCVTTDGAPGVRINDEGLRALSTKYGEKHLFITKSLDEAIAYCTNVNA